MSKPTTARRKHPCCRRFRGQWHGENIFPLRRWKSPSLRHRLLGLAEPYDFHARGFGFRVLSVRDLGSVA